MDERFLIKIEAQDQGVRIFTGSKKISKVVVFTFHSLYLPTLYYVQ
jgi:hypothetical protein